MGIVQTLKRSATKTMADIKVFREDLRHKKKAEKLIESMVATGKRMDPAIFKQCDEYAKDVFGSIVYSPWLKAYSVFAERFKEGWIPSNYYGRYVVPKMQGDYGRVSENKPLSRLMLGTNLLPDLAYSVNGLLYSVSMEPLKPAEFKEYLFKTCDRIVYKKDNTMRGRGVSVFDRQSFPNSLSFGNGVFQSYITQHPFFDAFDDHSVSTIRIITVVDDAQQVSRRSTHLRLPRSTGTHVTGDDAICVAIKPETGELSETGYWPNWTPTACHPDSKKEFKGQVIPHFKECLETCLALHRKMPFSRVIGWDVIVNDTGKVEIIEWQGHNNAILFPEVACGPCFADLGWQHLKNAKR